MDFLGDGSDDYNPRVRPYGENSLLPEPGRQLLPLLNGTGAPAETVLDIRRLVRKYFLVLLALLILGAAAGFTSVVMSHPRYKTRLLLEVLPSNGLPRNLSLDSGNYETTEVNIQTQISILRSGTFLKRGADRLQSESVPLAPTGHDLFSRLRQRIHPATQDPLENAKLGLAVAIETFDARPVNKTRLIELTCESTSPDVAAQFLNSMAAEYQEDTSRSRMQASQKTSEWLAAQIEDTKVKMQESEEHLREFIQSSGNVFAGQENTLDDTKLAQLKGQLATIQADRIAKQTRYELTLKNPPESLGEVLSDGGLRSYQDQINALRREKAALETTYTPKHEKVQRVDAQIGSLQKSYETEVHSVISRIKNDYEAALRQEHLLSAAYASQSQRVGSEGAKASQYGALKREVETWRQMYQTLLVQSNEAGLSSSVPISPIRVVEASAPPDIPYKPRPILNISFGSILGLALCAGLVFLLERSDRSIRTPGVSRRMFNAPELGVIPNLGSGGNALPPALRSAKSVPINGKHEDAATALVSWQSGPTFIAESFRGTLASILRNQATGKSQKAILITSPGPAEGKTTVIQNLGIALAETGRKVLLIDADFRRPHLHRKFSLPNEWGLIDLLCEDRALSEYPPDHLGVFTGFPGLSILPNRISYHNVAKALYSPRLRTIFETLIRRYDMVLIDAPPILHVADTRIIAPLADALILVLRCGITDRENAMEAFQRIQEDGLTLLGTVLTDYDLNSDRKRQYYYDYGDASRA
jgi:succinoglycan biosynthesis transport protein ExoP